MDARLDIAPGGQGDGTRFSSSRTRGWQTFGQPRLTRSGRAQRLREWLRRSWRGSEKGWLGLAVIMCCVAIIDVHASARREWPGRVAIVASEALHETDLDVTEMTPVVEQELATAHSAPRTAARSTASARADRTPSPGGRHRAHTKDQVRNLIRLHARAYGLDPGLPLAIAECESGFRWNAANGRSSARGVFQYLAGTWRTTPEGRKGTSVFDTDAHVRMAVAQIATSGTRPWNASRSCWSALVSSVDATRSETESATETATDSEAPDPAT